MSTFILITKVELFETFQIFHALPIVSRETFLFIKEKKASIRFLSHLIEAFLYYSATFAILPCSM